MKYTLPLAVLMVVFTFWAGAAEPEPIALPPEAAPLPEGMSLAELEGIAEHGNPTLVQAAARVRAAQAECVQVGLYPNPRIGYQATDMGVGGTSGKQGAVAGQEFVTAGKLKRNREVAAQEIQQAEFAWQAQRQRVVNDVRRAFYEVLVAQRTVELTDELVRIGQEGVKAAEALLKAKEVSRVDVLQARIEADSAGILAEKARNRHLAAWRNLALVIGSPDMPVTKLTGDLEENLAEFTWEATVNRVLGESPQVAEARTGVSRAEAVVSRECAVRIPNVDMQVGVAYDNEARDSIAEVQAGFALPLFNRNQGNIRKAEAELIAARHEVRRVELELQQQLAAAFEQYRNARYQVQRYSQQILPNAQASLDLVAAGYRQGEFNYITLLTAQRTFFQVNLAYVDSMRDLRTIVVAIEGYLLTDSLQHGR